MTLCTEGNIPLAKCLQIAVLTVGSLFHLIRAAQEGNAARSPVNEIVSGLTGGIGIIDDH